MTLARNVQQEISVAIQDHKKMKNHKTNMAPNQKADNGSEKGKINKRKNKMLYKLPKTHTKTRKLMDF